MNSKRVSAYLDEECDFSDEDFLKPQHRFKSTKKGMKDYTFWVVQKRKTHKAKKEKNIAEKLAEAPEPVYWTDPEVCFWPDSYSSDEYSEPTSFERQNWAELEAWEEEWKSDPFGRFLAENFVKMTQSEMCGDLAEELTCPVCFSAKEQFLAPKHGGKVYKSHALCTECTRTHYDTYKSCPMCRAVFNRH